MTSIQNIFAIRAGHWSTGIVLAMAITLCPALSLEAQLSMDRSANTAAQSTDFNSATNTFAPQASPANSQVESGQSFNQPLDFPVAPVQFDPNVQPASASVSVQQNDPVSEMSGAWTNFTAMVQQQWQQSGWAEKTKGLTGDFDLGRMLGSLAIVLGGYFGLVALMRFINPSKGGVPTEVLELLGTVPLAPRKQLQIVRLGSKLLLLVDSEEGTHPIGEISDPEEVEYLASLCPGRKKTRRSVASRIRSVTTRQAPPADTQVPVTTPSPAPLQTPAANMATQQSSQVTESHLASLLQSLSGSQRSGPAVFEA